MTVCIFPTGYYKTDNAKYTQLHDCRDENRSVKRFFRDLPTQAPVHSRVLYPRVPRPEAQTKIYQGWDA